MMEAVLIVLWVVLAAAWVVLLQLYLELRDRSEEMLRRVREMRDHARMDDPAWVIDPQSGRWVRV